MQIAERQIEQTRAVADVVARRQVTQRLGPVFGVDDGELAVERLGQDFRFRLDLCFLLYLSCAINPALCFEQWNDARAVERRLGVGVGQGFD